MARTSKKLMTTLALLLATTLMTGTVQPVYSAEEEDPNIPVADGAEPWTVADDTVGHAPQEPSYYDRREELEQEAVRTGDPIVASAHDALVSLKSEDEEDLTTNDDGYVALPPHATATFALDVPDAGSYHLVFGYRVPSDNIQELRADIRINGEKPYREADNLHFPVTWRTVKQDDNIDRYGNEVYPTSERIHDTYEEALNIAMFDLDVPLLFPFESGENHLAVTTNELPLEIETVELRPVSEHPDYRTYLEHHGASSPEDVTLTDREMLVMEGEDFAEKTQPHIRGERTKDYHFSPYDSAHSLINVLAPDMWQLPGSRVTYRFSVETDGFYRLGFRFQQGTKQEAPVYKRILIDGEVPFGDLANYAFPFTRNNVENTWLKGDDGDYAFYLEAGEHTLSLQSTASLYYTAYELLTRTIQEMNLITLDIRMVTGNRADENRDWNIELYVPDVKERLQQVADTLDAVYRELSEMAGQEEVTEWNNLRIIRDQILLYIQDKDGLERLVNNLDGFSQADGSLAQQIAGMIQSMLDQPLAIDQVYVGGASDEGMGKTPGFFRRMALSLEKLWHSFTRDEDTDQQLEKDALNIWINRPVMHIDVLREMINQQYPDPNVKINLSAMPDENRLLLSVIAGEAPDAVLGLSTAKPYDFALRGAAYDLTKFEDFGEAVTNFTAEMFVPFTHDGGIYAMPETATFHVLFYRTDILDQLGLEPPRTWEELIEIIPTLDRYGMNVQTMIAAADAFKPFGATVPFIQQFGGKVYSEDGMSVAFNDPKTIEAFELLTDLYIRYNLPHRIVNFYNNFKSGATPIGVSELNTYTLLKFAAPEISGQWAIAPNLGRVNENGEFINTQPDVTSGTMILNQSEKKEEAWEFLKWWMDEDVQLHYGNELQTRFGREYIWSSANLETVKRVPFYSRHDRKIIVEQIRIAREVPRHPAYFQVERELSNAWNTVVFDGTSVREALDRAALTTNRMMENKLKEFGYLDETGEKLKPLRIADAGDIQGLGDFVSSELRLPEELEAYLEEEETGKDDDGGDADAETDTGDADAPDEESTTVDNGDADDGNSNDGDATNVDTDGTPDTDGTQDTSDTDGTSDSEPDTNDADSPDADAETDTGDADNEE